MAGNVEPKKRSLARPGGASRITPANVRQWFRVLFGEAKSRFLIWQKLMLLLAEKCYYFDLKFKSTKATWLNRADKLSLRTADSRPRLPDVISELQKVLSIYRRFGGASTKVTLSETMCGANDGEVSLKKCDFRLGR